MEENVWNKSGAKKLLACFMEIEASQYSPSCKPELDKRVALVEKLILDFGVDHATVTNYTNMMLVSSSIMLDVYISKRRVEGNIYIHIGSEPSELWATRGDEKFDFESWSWYVPAPIVENSNIDKEVL